MIFLITRPIPEGKKTARKMEKMGIDTALQPCFSIHVIPAEAGILKELDTVFRRYDMGDNIVIITSLNGAKAYFRNYPESSADIVTVGKKAANFLEKKGYKNIDYAAKNVDRLVEFINREIDPATPLFYIRGKRVKKDLKKELPGFQLKDLVLYEAVEEKKFSAKNIELIKAKKISGILFYSAQTAKIFNKLVNASALANFLDKIEVFCLSPSIAKACSVIDYKKIHVAAEPNENSLFELIKNYVDKH